MPPQTWIPSQQFGFRKEHSTIHQCHRLTDTIIKEFEGRKYCSAVFLDISQAFDKLWHPDLLQKIQQTLPLRYFTLVRSYLQHRYFVVSYNNVNSSPVRMHSGSHRGASWPLFYTHYIWQISRKRPQPSLARLQTIRQLWQPTQTQSLPP